MAMIGALAALVELQISFVHKTPADAMPGVYRPPGVIVLHTD